MIRKSILTTNYAAREARARRLARAQGLTLRKSRRSDYTAGTYGLVDNATNGLVISDGRSGYGFDLDEIEEVLQRQ